MAKPTDTVPPWATAGNYAPSVFAPTVPQTKPAPEAGLPTPWSGTPRTEDVGLATFAAQGFSPQIPTAAQLYNEWLQRVGEHSNWVEDGTSAADADAHIMESDASGHGRAVLYRAVDGYVSEAGGAAPLPEGATVGDGKDLELGNTATVTAGDDIVISVGDDLVETIGTGAAVTYGAGAVVTTGAGSTIDMVDDGSKLITGTVLYLESSPLFAAGLSAWDGRAITVGDGTAAPRVAQPRFSYVAGPLVTAAAQLTTGASVTLQMRNGESAKIEMVGAVKSDTIGSTITTRLEANAVLLGNVISTYEATGAGSSVVNVSRSELYTHAVADALVTFIAFFGANVGNATIEGVSVTASHI